jgi:hypothetical protein
MDLQKPAPLLLPPRIRTLIHRTTDLLLRFLRCMVPGVAIPKYCPDCRTKSRLTREEVIHWGEDCWVQGIRFWQCPNCGCGSEEHYSFIKYLDFH